MHPSHVLAAVGLLLAGSVAPAAHAAQSYDNCTGYITSLPATIGTQGTWCLAQDVSTAITAGAAVTVLVNNVTLDCNHFRIGGLAAGLGTGATGVLVSGRTTFALRHCNIRGFLAGIRVDGGSGHLVEDNVFQGNTSVGIDIQNADGVVIQRNQVNDTGLSTTTGGPRGIGADILSSAVVIRSNVIRGVKPGFASVAIGIDASARGAVVEDNRIFDVVGAGDGMAVGINLEEYSKAMGNTIDSVAGLTSAAIVCEPSFARSYVQGNVSTRAGGIWFTCVNGGGNVDY